MADISNLRKSISEMSTEELMELVGGTRNARVARPVKKPRAAKPKKAKQISMADLMSRIDTMSPEEAAEALASLQKDGEEEDEDDEEDDPCNNLLHGSHEDITMLACFEQGFSYREKNPHVKVNPLMRSESIRWREFVKGWETADRQDNSWRKQIVES